MNSSTLEPQPAERAGKVTNTRWHLITGEYPPQGAGVSDYTCAVAAGLAAEGDEVHVWCPGSRTDEPGSAGVTVHRELGAITPCDLRHVSRQLDRFPAPRRLMVQWVPHGYGYQSMNVGFCLWLWNRARRGDDVEIMLHEPYLPFAANSVRQSAAALVHRFMTIVLLRAASRVWMSIPEWEGRWRPYALGRRMDFRWLPVPSNIAVAHNSSAVSAVRRLYAPEETLLIGHFGTYGKPVASVLEPVLLALAAEEGVQRVLLLGMGSREFRERLLSAKPALESSIAAAGALSPEELSSHVAACDFLIQPYPDGISTRRSSAMLALSHGKAMVSTSGELTEDFWTGSGAVGLARAGDVPSFIDLVKRLREDAGWRARLGANAKDLYQRRFDMQHVIRSLRAADRGRELTARR